MRQTSAWNGDVWRALVAVRSSATLDAITANVDYGCGILRAAPNTAPLDLPMELRIRQLTFGDLDANRQQWLRLHTFEQSLAWIDDAVGYTGPRRYHGGAYDEHSSDLYAAGAPSLQVMAVGADGVGVAVGAGDSSSSAQ